MARPSSETLTPREAQLMDILWEHGPVTADQIREALPDRPHDSTVRTLLRVLEQKRYVRHDVRGKAYVYRAALQRAKAERKAVRALIQRFFGGSAEALVQRVIEDKHLTAEQLEALKQEIEPTRRGPGRKRGKS